MKKTALIIIIFTFFTLGISKAQSYQIIKGDDIKELRENRIIKRDNRRFKRRHNVRRVVRRARHVSRRVRVHSRIGRRHFGHKNRVYVRSYVNNSRRNVE